MKPTEQELRELKLWIHEHVFGLPPCGDCDPCLGGRSDQCAINPAKDYPTDPAAAMMVLEKCATKLGLTSVEIYHNGICFGVSFKGSPHCYQHESLPHAICKFAQKLWGGGR